MLLSSFSPKGWSARQNDLSFLALKIQYDTQSENNTLIKEAAQQWHLPDSSAVCIVSEVASHQTSGPAVAKMPGSRQWTGLISSIRCLMVSSSSIWKHLGLYLLQDISKQRTPSYFSFKYYLGKPEEMATLLQLKSLLHIKATLSFHQTHRTLNSQTF